jgi:hypothetical protein
MSGIKIGLSIIIFGKVPKRQWIKLKPYGIKMKKTKQKLRSKLRSVMATIIMSSMIQTTFAATAAPPSSSSWTSQDTGNIFSAVLQTGNQFIQMRGQNMSIEIQQAAAARTRSMMSTMQPQMGPAQFFPECPVLQRISNIPDKNSVCIAPPDLSNKNAIASKMGEMEAYQNMAAMSARKYENSKLQSIECINGRQKNFDAQLMEFQNRLRAMADQLKQDSQTFRDNTDQMMSAMNSNWADLHGQGTSIDAQTGDFTKQFSPQCATFLTGNKIDNKGGLVGMMDSSKEANLAAFNFSQARPQIEASIVNDGNLIAAAIKAGGINAIDLNNVSEDNKKKIDAVIKAELASNQKLVDTYNKDLAADGAFNLGNLDAANSADAEAKIKNAEANYKNNLMRNCMAGKSGSTLNEGLVIDNSTIASLITQSGIEGGTSVLGYRNEVMKIINNSDLNVTLDMKLARIQALENPPYNYKNMVFNSNVGGQNVAGSASQAFAKLASDCESFYTQASTDGGPSPQQKAQRAQTAMRQIKNNHDALGAKISQAVNAKLISCSSSQVNGTKACTADNVKPGADNFCVANAVTCSDQIQGCYGEISAKVGQKTALIKNLGLQYNAAANQMIDRANVLFTQQKAAVAGLLSNIQKNYPGMKFVIGGQGTSGAGGKDDPLFVSNPALSPSTFGIDLVAGGKMGMEQFLNELPKKIESLQAIVADQQAASKKQVDEYLNGPAPLGLLASLDKEKAAWEALSQQCKNMYDTSLNQIAEASKQVDTQNAKILDFCSKYDSLRVNPDPLCSGADELTSTISDIVGSLNQKAVQLSHQAKYACASANNEATKGADAGKGNVERTYFETKIKPKVDAVVELQGTLNSPTSKPTKEEVPLLEIKIKDAKQERDHAIELCAKDYIAASCEEGPGYTPPQKPQDAKTKKAEENLNNLMGEIQKTPCTGIASAPGKGMVMPWMAAPSMNEGRSNTGLSQ